VCILLVLITYAYHYVRLKKVNFGYYVVIVSLVNKINVSSLSEFIDIQAVFIIVSVTLVRFVVMF